MTDLHEERYFINNVATMTGLSKQLIRTWENRYQMILPERLDNGYRVYSMNDILLLKEIKKLRDEGYSIQKSIQKGFIRRSLDERNSRLNNVESSPYVEKLIQSGKVYDEEQMVSLLKQAHQQYGLELFLQNTIQPFMYEVGILWYNQTWDESQETVSSLVVKDFLTEISRNFKNRDDAPLIVGFSLPDEEHEIPLQILLLQMRINGWNTIRIGASPKFSSIETLVDYIQPQKVVFLASTLIPFQQNKTLFKDLDSIAERYPHISFYIGGYGVWAYTQIIKPKYMTISHSIDDIILLGKSHESLT